MTSKYFTTGPAKIFEEVLQKKIEVQHTPVDVLQVQFNSGADAIQKLFSGLMLWVASCSCFLRG
jgi:hypothetical protein